MKLIIDIPEMAYEAYKEWHKQRVSNVEQSLIALAMPYEERAHEKWIPVTYRPMTEEEEKELCVKWGIKEGSLEDWEKRVFTCPLPDDGQEILISHGKYVQEDICSWDEDCCGLEEYGDWDGVDAWMPKPEPYKKEGD